MLDKRAYNTINFFFIWEVLKSGRSQENAVIWHCLKILWTIKLNRYELTICASKFIEGIFELTYNYNFYTNILMACTCANMITVRVSFMNRLLLQ